jgi:hypothetical protein
MKLQSIVGLVALLFPLSIAPAIASQQTDLQWKKYLGGRKIVQFSNYSSSFGGGGMYSQQELHFCSNGRFDYVSESSVTMNAGEVSGSSGGTNRSTGTWKIIESNPQLVLIEFVSSEGEKQRSLLGFGQDGRLYNDAGKRLLTTASNACR